MEDAGGVMGGRGGERTREREREKGREEANAEAFNWLAWTYQASKHAQAEHPHVLVGYDL